MLKNQCKGVTNTHPLQTQEMRRYIDALCRKSEVRFSHFTLTRRVMNKAMKDQCRGITIRYPISNGISDTKKPNQSESV